MEELFERYHLSEFQTQAFHNVKKVANMPSFMENIDDEELIWAVAVATFDMPSSPNDRDIKFYEKAVEARVRKLEEAETRYGWFSLKWTDKPMRQLITNWFCGMLVIDPDLQTRDGSPIQFVHEFYGPESKYPRPENQTDEWKKDMMDLYVLMARSTCKAYPNATVKGIVSFSDMKDFDWGVYDMETKSRNADIGALIPNKLARMISIRPDEKMTGFYEDMTPRMRKKYGFVLYDNYESAKRGEGDLLPPDLPTFVGGNYRVDILRCLKRLFVREPEALELLVNTYSEMERAGEIPRPAHMQ